MPKEYLLPLFDRVYVEKIKSEARSPGGLVLVDQSEESTLKIEAVVLAIGPDVDLVKKGDRVVINKYGGTECIIRGRLLTVLREQELFGVWVTQAADWGDGEPIEDRGIWALELDPSTSEVSEVSEEGDPRLVGCTSTKRAVRSPK